MPRKNPPKARFSAREKALMKAAKKVGSETAKKVGSETARARLKEILAEWCATPDAELPRAD